MTILPLHQILPAIHCLQLVSDNARSPVYAQSFAKRPILDTRDPKATNRWSSTAAPRMKQQSSQSMPTLMSPRDEKFVRNDLDKKIALGAQAIRLPVRQSSRRDMYDTSLLPKKIGGGSAPVSPLVIPVRQFSSQRKQLDKSQGLRIPIRQISQQCLLKETEQTKERRNLSNHKKTTELLAHVLEDFSHMPIEEKGYKVDPFFL